MPMEMSWVRRKATPTVSVIQIRRTRMLTATPKGHRVLIPTALATPPQIIRTDTETLSARRTVALTLSETRQQSSAATIRTQASGAGKITI